MWLDTLPTSHALQLFDADFESAMRHRLGLSQMPSNAPGVQCSCNRFMQQEPERRENIAPQHPKRNCVPHLKSCRYCVICVTDPSNTTRSTCIGYINSTRIPWRCAHGFAIRYDRRGRLCHSSSCFLLSASGADCRRCCGRSRCGKDGTVREHRPQRLYRCRYRWKHSGD